MSTGIIIITVIIAVGCVVAGYVMLAAGARALRTTRRNELGLASNNAREQANRTFGATAVGLVIIFLTLLAMPLVVKLGDGMVADSTEEAPTSEAVDAH
mgnify:FL=1